MRGSSGSDSFRLSTESYWAERGRCGEFALGGPDGTVSRGWPRSKSGLAVASQASSPPFGKTISLENPVRSIGLKSRRIQQIVKSGTTGRMLAGGIGGRLQFDGPSVEAGSSLIFAAGLSAESGFPLLAGGLLLTISPSTNTSTRPSGAARP